MDWHSERKAGPLSARGGRNMPVPQYACSAKPTAEGSEIARPQAGILQESAGRSQNTRSVSHPCKKGCVRRRPRSLRPRLHEVTDSSFSAGSAKRGIKRGHKDSPLSRDTDHNLVTRPGLLSKTQGLSLAPAERRHGAQGRPCLPGSHAAPPSSPPCSEPNGRALPTLQL